MQNEFQQEEKLNDIKIQHLEEEIRKYIKEIAQVKWYLGVLSYMRNTEVQPFKILLTIMVSLENFSKLFLLNNKSFLELF